MIRVIDSMPVLLPHDLTIRQMHGSKQPMNTIDICPNAHFNSVDDRQEHVITTLERKLGIQLFVP